MFGHREDEEIYSILRSQILQKSRKLPSAINNKNKKKEQE